MSLLLRDRIGVELSPQRVTWVRMARGLRSQVITKGSENIVPQTDAPVWRPALDKLKQMMRSEEWKNADATIVLSNHFMRYDCLPWNAAVKSEDEQLALARHRMVQVYGAAAQAWTLRLSPARKGAARLVAAVDEALLEMIKLAATEAGLKLHSIQPYLMSSFNRHAKILAQRDGWFVAAEGGRFALALFRSGQWKRIQLRRGEGMAALHEWLERENLASGEDTSCREIFLFAPELEREAVLPAYQVHRLELAACHGYSPITDVQYSIALSGVA